MDLLDSKPDLPAAVAPQAVAVSITCRFAPARAPVARRAERVATTSRARTSTRIRIATRPSTPSPITCRRGPQDDPAAYWDAADLYERANGRLYVSADFALPRELSVEDQIELARAFAHELTDDEHLPYTLAIHAGRDRGRPRAQPARAPDVLGAAERRHRAVARRSGSGAPIPRIPNVAARRRAARSTDAAGSSRPASVGRRSRTSRSNAPAGPSGSIIGATSGRVSIGKPANTTDPPRLTWSAAGTITTAWKARSPSSTTRRHSRRWRRRLPNSRPRAKRCSATGLPMTSEPLSHVTTRTRTSPAAAPIDPWSDDHVERP